METTVEGDLDTTPVWGSGDLQQKNIGCESIRIAVTADADASRQASAALLERFSVSAGAL